MISPASWPALVRSAVRPYQAGTAAAIVLIAAVAMFDSRRDILFDLASAGGVGPGFYPFWSSAMMGTAAAVVAYLALTTPQPAAGVFTGRESVFSVLKLVLPMFAYAASLQWLGFYISTGVYMGFYAWYLGRYRWYSVLAVGIVVPLAVYLSFEVGFKLILPKSIFYALGLPI